MSAYHEPVLLQEVLDALAPALTPADGLEGEAGARARIYVDATTGGGGHAEAVITRLRPSKAILLDRDLDALAFAAGRIEAGEVEVTRVHAPFARMADELAALGIPRVSAILADLGVSSFQLDTAERGFSFQADGPLDMRMDASQGRTAAELIAETDEGALTRILREFGEEPQARRIARALKEDRPQTTGAAAGLIARVAPSRPKRGKGGKGKQTHPATRTFQALRIAVNGELDQLDALLEDGPALLEVGGRLAIISFHSLEDRRVKQAFRRLSSPPPLPRGLPVAAADVPPVHFSIPRGTAGGVTGTDEEIAHNPRARSARLRVLERVSIGAPA